MDTFRKYQNEVIGVFNKYNWLAVDVSKVGHNSSKRYVDSCYLIMVIDKQSESIGIMNQTILNASKGINIMPTTMGGMVQDLHNIYK